MTDGPLMSAATARVGSAVVLTVGGDVDLYTAPQLVDTVVAALHPPGGGAPTTMDVLQRSFERADHDGTRRFMTEVLYGNTRGWVPTADLDITP